jgi:TP901 family phage tail tape measure protein
LANKDDLSVNINVGLNVDKAAFDDVKEELKFILELQKELGVEGAKKIKVGGYSTSASPDRTARNKAASQVEKMGGDWSGIDIAEKAEVELAKMYNQAAEELAKVFKIDFVPEAAKALGEIDFSMPNPEEIFKNSNTAQEYGDKLQKATEDFFMNAAGEVTISPAMLMAAAERVFKNNPNIAVPRSMEKISGIIKPTPAFGNAANFDQKLSEEFNQFITQAVGDNPAAATKVSDFLISKLKVLMSGIIDDAQKAREDVFKSVRGSEGDESTENIIRYADDAARRAVAMAEQARGLQAGTTAVFGRGLLPEKFRANPDAVSDPQQLLNVLIGEYSDEVTGAIMAAVPDPSKVAEPIAQILMNPYILGDKFATGYQDEINKALKRRAPAVAEVAAPMAVAPRGGGANNPDINLLRKYLTEQKALVEDKGRTLMAGLDTEFNYKIDEKLTELGLVIEDGTGKFVEIFKFLQIPNDLQAMYEGSARHPLGSARKAEDLLERGRLLGIPKENIGVPGDSEANFLQYRQKIAKLVDVLNLLSELGISLTGSNFQAAEASNIKKAIEYVNSRSANMGLDALATPNLSNVFDPNAISKTLSAASPELTKIFDSPEVKNGISGGLNNLIKNIAKEFPEFFARYSDQFNMAESSRTFEYKAAGGQAEAHYALTDAAASLIVKDFVEEFGDNAATLLVPIAKDLNTKVQAAAGGSGGNKPPSTPMGAADKPEDDPMASRAAASLQQLLLVGRKYQDAIAGLTEAERIKVEQRLKVLQGSREQVELLAEIAELEKKRSEILAEAAEVSAGSSGFARARQVLGTAGPEGPLTQGDAAAAKRYQQQTIEATKLGTAIAELTIAGQKRERQVISAVKEEARYKQVSEQLTQNMRKEIDATYENAQAGKQATAQIKNQMQDQVNAQKAVQRQTQSLMNTWVTSRYALYDIGNFYQNVAQNLIRVSRQIFDTTRSYRNFETAFTSVERAMQLSQEGAVDLRNQFIKLSETIPVSFEEISRIATLGAQMGIAADGIVGFTDTIAKFASITGISAETVAQQFGRIAELADVDPTEFNNLGSAVAFAGVNAVATESEILTLSQSIAAVSNQVGITAPEIVGLGTALASVGIPAEQARGVFTRVFADIDRAASLGGESLQALSQVTGMSAEKISSSWGQEGAANEVFVALLKGLNSADNLTEAFDSLNIVETREINTLTRLAKNMDVVMQALDDSGMSFESATFLGDSFDRTVDNLDSKLTLLKTNFDSLTASLMSSFGPALGMAADLMSSFFRFLKGAEDSLLFRFGLPVTGAVIALGAVFAATAAAGAKLTAQLYAFRVAQINAANSPTAVDGTLRQVKALLGLNSGLIEIRENVSGVNERGLVEPVNFRGLFTNVKKQQQELLNLKNIYMSVGDVARQTMDAKSAEALGDVRLARLEADAINNALISKRLEIEALERSADPADLARAAAMRTAYSQAYVVSVEGEIRVLTRLELEEQKGVITSSNMSAAKKREALARLENATAINLETKSASQAFTSLAGKITGFLGIAGLIASLIPTVLALFDAFQNLNKIDLTESGGGVESLREAILKDTQAVEDGTMKAIATARVEYKTYKTVTDQAAKSIYNLVSANGSASGAIKKATEDVKGQTVAIADNTKEWIANAIMRNEKLQEWDFIQIQQTMAQLGLDFEQVIADMVAQSQGANINPLDGVDEQIAKVRNEITALVRAETLGTVGSEKIQERLNLQETLKGLENTRSLLLAVGDSIKQAFSETALWGAIKGALGLEGADNAITKLIDKYKDAMESGKGLKKIFNEVKVAAIQLTGATGKDLLNIQSAQSLQGLRDVIAGMLTAAKAASTLELRTVKASAALIALKAADKLEIESLEQALASIDALLLGLESGIDGVGGAAESAADKLGRLLNEASSGIQGVLDLRGAIRSLGKSMAESKDFSLDTDLGAANIGAVLSVIESIGSKAGGNFKQAERNLNIFKLTLADMGAPQRAINLVNNAIGKLGGSTNLTKKQAEALRKQFASIFGTFKTNFQAGFNEVDKVENKIRSLTDFVSDLRGVLQSAFDIRYGAQTGLDAITTAWFNLTQAAKEAEKAVKSANDEINQSLADKTVLQYQLSVAQRYNDEKRAAVIRAKLAKLDQQILDQQQQLADANSANDKSLVGNTKSAIDNRAKVRDLVTQYNSYLLSLANTNMSSTDLAAKAKELEADFLAQGIALGYAEKDLKSYTSAFANDFTKVLNGVPKDITITVNTDPALRAIEEFAAKAREALSTIVAPLAAAAPAQRATSDFFNLPGMTNTRPGPEIDGKKGDVVTGPKGTTWAWDNKNKEWDKVAKKAMGGYVSGPGGPTSDSIPAMLSNGEYVIQARSVAAYGLDFMNALNQQRVGFAPAQGSFNGGSAGGSQMVYLSPEDRALLRAAVDRPIALYTENAKIAQSANAGNVLLAQRGTN